MKIAIIGASSFIGQNLIKYVDRKNWQITAVVRNKKTYQDVFSKYNNVSLVECDMKDYINLGKLIGYVDCAVYLTWNGTRGETRADSDRQKNNCEKSMIAIKSLVEFGCKKIITAGSQAEYGPWFLNRKLKETDEEKPNTEYGKYKLKFYQDAKAYCEEKDVTLIEPRFFSLYGANDFEGTMIISILKKMLQNESCDLTECKQKWDFLYIDDAIKGLTKLIEKDNIIGVYNFGSGKSYPLKHYVEEMHRITESSSMLIYGKIPYPETGMVNVDPCVDKLEKLGWKAEVSFEEGIKKVLEYL